MVYGLGPDSDSELSDLPPSPPSSPRFKQPSVSTSTRHESPPPLTHQAPERSRSSPPFKSQHPLRPKRQASISQPQPPSSPKRRKQAPASSVQPPGKREYAVTRRSAKRPTYTKEEDSSEESQAEEEIAKPKRRRKPHAASRAPEKSTGTSKPLLKRGRSRVSEQVMPPPSSSLPPKRESKKTLPLELRPASFLTSGKSSSFLTKALPIPSLNGGAKLQPRIDIWSYAELNGLTWVRLDIQTGTIFERTTESTIVAGNNGACWWPAEVTLRTSNELKMALCSLNSTLEVTSSAVDESNILTFRRPHISSARFPTFKSAYTPPSTFTSDNLSTANDAETSIALTTADGSAALPTDPIALETAWKAALARAFQVDTESNDGLEDIFLLFSQKSKSPRDEDGSTQASGDTILEEEDEGEKTDEGDILENGTIVLCRYRTRYYPAKILSYLPREGKRRCGKYHCRFADDNSRIAARHEIMTTLDEGFVTCPLGSYQRYSTHNPQAPHHSQASHRSLRAPTPEPRASSPSPESSDTKINPSEYCARERMRDQLKPILPFLQGIIERTYVPAQGLGRAEGDQVEVLDRHAVFMQGARARKNLAYSVHTGDLNEDDCEELMFEVSRWALRGERWASGSGLENGGDSGQHSDEKPKVDNGEKEGDKDKEQAGDKTESVVKENEESVEGKGQCEEGGEAGQAGTSGQDVEMKVVEEDSGTAAVDKEAPKKVKPEAGSGDTTEIESEICSDRLAITNADLGTARSNAFHRLIQLQPPRPTGATDYEELTPEERMGYISDVLYPEAAALILSYRRGIRTHPGPLADSEAEYSLYVAGLQAAKNTTSKEDWVDQILAVRQLREMNAKRHGADVEEPMQVVVPGGTRSRPKFVSSKTGSMLK